jgi:CheY-like chemotaxis protein
VPLRILFADDSMTAQNMGKRILTEAGYDVIAVSNGAAAVKKIAEHKPDIIILDVYMPGYTGLEVCEKVRASHETSKTPVLLTVGKMEPYRAEDANRVKADGVIIKPFEASDLLAIVKKLEERIVPKAAPVGEQTILLDRPPDFSQFERARAEAATAPAHVEEPQPPMQTMVEVPDHMATSSAFSDLLGSEPPHMMETFTTPAPVKAVVEEFPAPAEPAEFHVSSFGESSFHESSIHESVMSSASMAEPEPTATPVAAPTPELKINVVQASGNVDVEPVDDQEAEATAGAHIETTAASDTQPIPPYEEPEFAVAEASQPEPRSEAGMEATPAAPVYVDPGMSLDAVSFESFVSQPVAERAASLSPDTGVIQSENGLGHFSAAHASAETATPSRQDHVSEDDFDARVAAAMAAYDQAAEVEAEPEAEPTHSAPMTMETEAPVSFEYIPAVRSAQASQEPVIHPVAQHATNASGNHTSEHDSFAKQDSVVEAVRHESELPTSVITAATSARAEAMHLKAEEAIVAGIESQLPVVAAAAAASHSGSDSHQVIADVVHRVMERFKPELIAEIVRELKFPR